MTKFLGLLLMLCLNYSCLSYWNGDCYQVSSAIDAGYNSLTKDSEIIDLQKIYDFEWDTLFVINGMIYDEEIKEYTGIDCDCDIVPDNTEMYLFSKDGKLVRKSINHCLNSFRFSVTELGRGGIKRIESQKSKFKVSQYYQESNFYVLKPID